MRRVRSLGLLAVAALVLAGCGGSRASTSAKPTPAATSAATTSATPTATTAATPTATPTARTAEGKPGTVSKVLVVIEENHTYDQMKAGMPYLARLSDTYGYATHWTALAHPSEPNYLAIAGGSTFGVTDDQPPAAHEGDLGDATSVFDQALGAGRTARTYAESMPDNCHLEDAGRYAVRHNPWAYFPSGRAGCRSQDLPLGQFSRDTAANALPDVGFLIPDLDHDAHDGTLATADAWLQRQLDPVLSSTDFTSGRLVVVVTADEDDRSSDNTVLTSVLSSALHHRIVDTPLTHYSLSRYLSQVLGVAPLRNAATAPDLRAAFGL